MIKPAYSVSFLFSINIFVWQNVLYFLDAPRIYVFENCVVFASVQLVQYTDLSYCPQKGLVHA